DGSGQTRVTSGLFVFDPSWSPDGRIGFVYDGKNGQGGGQRTIATINPDGTDLKDVVTFTRGGFGFFGPNWSADGQKIAVTEEIEACILDDCFGSFIDIHMLNADGTGDRELKDDAVEPNWSPDSALIAFANLDQRTIDVVDRAGSYITNYGGSGDGFAANPAWSPDGKKFVFEGSAGA